MKRVVVHLFCILTSFSVLLPFFIMPVHADYDYEFYYPDPDSYIAYEYFMAHGYNDLILSSSGNESISYNVNLTNDNTLTQSNSDVGSITGNEHTTGTINSNNSTLGARYMVCTTNNAVSGTQTYSCYFSSTSSGVNNSQSITIKLNENTYTAVDNDFDIGTVNQDGTTTGTISASVAFRNRLYAKIPKLSGTYTHPAAFSSSDRFNVNENEPSFLIFMANRVVSPATYNIYNASGSNVTVSATVNTIGSGWGLYIYKLTGRGNATLDITWLNTENVIPIYAGKEAFLTDSIRERIGMKTKTNSLIDDGNDDTAGKVNNTGTATSNLNSKFTDFDNLENAQVQNMESKLNNINTTPDILNNSNFLVSVRWVRSVFNRVTDNTPFGSVLGFSLLLGLALIFLGRYR